MNMNRRFYWEITAFSEKHTSNIHFFVLNVHFWISNVHFFFIQKSTYMKISIIRNSIVGVYFGSSTVCGSRICEIQQNDSGEIYMGVD